MSVSLEIVPSSHTLDLYGEPDRSTSYSLSGHVAISLHSASSLFERRRALRLVLESLEITLEGQSELFAPSIGYHPFRICSVKRELAPAEPIELSNEGLEDADAPATWNVVFDIPVPGWLPPSTIFGDGQNGDAGISYSLFATARFAHVEGASGPRNWLSWASICSAFSFRTRAVSAPMLPMTLRRVAARPAAPASSSLFRAINYAVQAEFESSGAERDESHIPEEVLKKLHVIASTPEHVSIDEETTFPFSLRIRTDELSEDECRRLRVDHFCVEVVQEEKYRTTPPSSYTTAYPVPAAALQPPRKPLRNPHSMQAMYDMGLICAVQGVQSHTRSFSILAPSSSGRFKLAGDGYVFSGEPNSRWYSMDTTIPFSRCALDMEKSTHDDWWTQSGLRQTMDSPHLYVRHKLHVALTCTWDVDGAPVEGGAERARATERVTFSVPLSFVHIPAPAPLPPRTPSPTLEHHRCISSLSDSSTVGASIDSALPPPSMPYAQPYQVALPAYSQLFYSNGDQKLEYDLPMYEPPASPAPSDASSSSA